MSYKNEYIEKLISAEKAAWKANLLTGGTRNYEIP